MPRMNGMEAIREIKRGSKETKILVLTMHRTDEYIVATLKAGADGYVLKDATHGELMVAIRNVLAGRRYISPAISEQVIEGYLEGKKSSKPLTTWETLTQREREILKLIAEGHRNKKIADYLCISVKTVEKHRANLMQKLDLHSISALTALAIEKGRFPSKDIQVDFSMRIEPWLFEIRANGCQMRDHRMDRKSICTLVPLRSFLIHRNLRSLSSLIMLSP
jgi:DNA-binding NarL/FixJ family response regulator